MATSGSVCLKKHGLQVTGNPLTPFTSCLHQEDEQCVALMIVRCITALVDNGVVQELLTHDLPRGFTSSTLLDTEVLAELEITLEAIDVPQYLYKTQVVDLAHIAVALLNYDVRHLGDDVHSLFSPEERKAVMVMIEQIMPELLTTLLKMDYDELRAKQQREREEIMRWLNQTC